MDADALRELYPTYTDDQIEEAIAIHAEAAALRARIEGMGGLLQIIAGSALDQVLRLLTDKIPPI
ncbi:hypothetical protein J5J86_13915 [Aquabacter sp. L1I39]|uniref:hypothetical protein n=1 Tax=Aquabacter sp. L1I39 TaxID=2820278 RepID=UPI001ADB0DE9|nr:hypothetical protein [Aquabacter sp. L1I39]QTL01902.1 hypothetical protein J5J86_13915 [Aquabacter sp. L1I39]